jgi:two-component system, NarL family, invasion response regulator UvrY
LSPSDFRDVESKGLVLLCECGQRDCRETVSISQAALEAYRRTNRPVLAPGHQLGRLEKARRSAAASIEDAHALRAQSAQQLQRSRRAMRARVLAVDDSEIFLQVADSVVSGTTGLRLVGTATSGEEAIELLPQLQPDLVLLDVHMPGISGIEAARIIGRDSPQTVVVLVSAEPEGFAASAESAGAVAILGKVDLSPDMLDELWLKHGSRD